MIQKALIHVTGKTHTAHDIDIGVHCATFIPN